MPHGPSHTAGYRRSLLGYRPSEVARELDSLHVQMNELRAQLDEFVRDEATLKDELAVAAAEAHRLREELTAAETSRTADAARAQDRMDHARAQVRDLEREFAHRKGQLAWEIHSLGLDKERFEADFRTLLLEYLDMLPSRLPIAPADRPESVTERPD